MLIVPAAPPPLLRCAMTLRSDKVASRVADRVAPARKIPPMAAPEMMAVIRVILGRDHPDVTAVTEESLLALRDALGAFRRESSLLEYAKQVAVRTALSARRRNRSRGQRLEQMRRAVVNSRQGGAGAGARPELMARARRLAAFRSLLDDLPDAQAEAFALRVVLDYSPSQVAEATATSLSTARSRMRVATERLKQRVKAGPTLREILRGRA
ncbi:MAG TPA: sigma-70 family RNA polymerase sigma factor [Polyangia bacterium]|nr:sigma-70 family RNA polymerase sigma factor [Polyangia bacterium]